MYKTHRCKLAAAVMLVTGTPAAPLVFAENVALEEIIVTARRMEEGVQSVPMAINAVSGEQLSELNLRNFQDLQNLIAGLTLEEDSIAPTASVRGVRYETFSGTTPTVDFYLNETPTSPLTVSQVMFDIGRVEVLRGPQGTLRGRASPSGSIMLVTNDAGMSEFGGYVDVTATDESAYNVEGALNFPLLEDRLALRVAGFWEENDINEVESIYGHGDSDYEGSGYRVTLTGAPTDNLYFKLMYQNVEPDRDIFFPVESANRADSSLPPASRDIAAKDRKSVQDIEESSEQELEATILNVSWDINDQHQLNYVGSYLDETINRITPSDITNAIDDSFPEGLQDTVQNLYTRAEAWGHELRIQSTEPLWGKISYIVGGLYSEAEPEVRYSTPNLLPFGGGSIFETNIVNRFGSKQADTKEVSYFTNLTYHFSDDTQVSAGARYIDFEANDYLALLDPFADPPMPGTLLQDGKREEDTTIYLVSFKHNFTEDMMGYATWGTSWRYGPSAIGDQSSMPSALQQKFTFLPSEESDSYELGMKSTWLDQRLRVNVAAYYQEYENYPYYSSQSIYYRTDSPIDGSPVVGAFNFLAPVPVDVVGVELETEWAATENLTLGALLNYAKGEIDDGEIPCNDYDPNDGVPDNAGTIPTLAEIEAIAGADNLTSCIVDFRTNYAPDYTATFTGQYDFQLGSLGAFVRGLWTWYDDADNDPSNPLDDVDSYSLFNLYVGVQQPEGSWSAMLYVKNLFDTERVIERAAEPGSVSFATGGQDPIVSEYRLVALTAPQEVGFNVRYNF